MTTRFAHTSFALALACCVGLTAGCAPKKPAPEARAAMAQAEAPQMTPEQMQAAFEKASTVNENHRVLDPLVGKWKVTSKFWMQPGAPAEESTATATYRWILGGRFLQQDYSGKFQGKPFTGVGTYGYNTVGEKYESTWVDSMGTQIMKSEGTISPAKDVITFHSRFDCPMVNGPRETTATLTIADKNRHVYEMFDKAPDGTNVKSMELVFTRDTGKKASKAKAAK